MARDREGSPPRTGLKPSEAGPSRPWRSVSLPQEPQAIGKSKGGWTTKILALTAAPGNLVRLILLPGNRFDTVGAAPLIHAISFGAMLAEAFDRNRIIAAMNECGAVIGISQHPRRTKPLPVDLEPYKGRHLIDLRQENDPPDRFLIFLIFCKLERVPAHRPARRQGRHLFRRHALPSGSPHQLTLNLSRP